MRQSAVRLAKAYTPMIKFVGGKHQIVKHEGAAKGHPCATDGLKPGSEGCVPVGEFLSKLKPFEVVNYRGSSSQAQKAAGGKSTGAGSKTSTKYVFQNRPLKDNEVGSIFELPARFRGKPISDIEAEAINGGGAV